MEGMGLSQTRLCSMQTETTREYEEGLCQRISNIPSTVHVEFTPLEEESSQGLENNQEDELRENSISEYIGESS